MLANPKDLIPKLARRGQLDKDVAIEVLAVLSDDDPMARYLLIEITTYADQLDTTDYTFFTDLEQVRVSIEAHVCRDAREDYAYTAAVIDLEDEKMLSYDIIHEIRWKDTK
jgi:hypothetical protein